MKHQILSPSSAFQRPCSLHLSHNRKIRAYAVSSCESQSSLEETREDRTCTATSSGREGDMSSLGNANSAEPSEFDFTDSILPKHIAVIMDGNARWAKQKGMPVFKGHEEGITALRRMIKWCKNLAIPALTVFAFSTENWNRAETEVNLIMKMTERVLAQETSKLVQEGIRVSFIGDRGKLPAGLRKAMTRMELDTWDLNSMHLTVALNFGGRQDIVKAVQTIAKRAALNKLDSFSEEYLEDQLSELVGPSHLPIEIRQPDLLIRSGGTKRLSNFLLWDMAYSEIHFSNALWPDFQDCDFLEALQDFARRTRSYGCRLS